MTISSINGELNKYIHSYLKSDLEKIHSNLSTEISQFQEVEANKPKSIQNPFEIKDEYVPNVKPKVDVTLEERLEQVISPEEIKNLLSLIVRAPRTFSFPGELVDLKG